jgi:hypothetical protein
MCHTYFSIFVKIFSKSITKLALSLNLEEHRTKNQKGSSKISNTKMGARGYLALGEGITGRV